MKAVIFCFLAFGISQSFASGKDCFPCLDDEIAMIATATTKNEYPQRLLDRAVFCGKWRNGYVEPARTEAYKWCQRYSGPRQMCTYGALYSKERWPCRR